MFRHYSYTIIREHINLYLLKLQLLKESIKIHQCMVNTVVLRLHTTTAKQCNTHTPIRTQYMQPHHHRIHQTLTYFNGLF